MNQTKLERSVARLINKVHELEKNVLKEMLRVTDLEEQVEKLEKK